MNKIVIAGFLAAALALPAAVAAQAPPSPGQEHAWLERLAGEWETELEIVADPSQPPLKVQAKETTRKIGPLWIVAVGETPPGPMSFTRALTLGYDAATKKYVGTWVESVSPYLGRYEGTMDADGKTLTLLGERPHPFDGRLVKVREVVEIKSPDLKVATTSLQREDGTWTKLVTITAQRKR